MKILLAVDGSAHTKKMLAYLATHMETLGRDNEFTALTVEPPLPPRARSIVGKDVADSFHAPWEIWSSARWQPKCWPLARFQCCWCARALAGICNSCLKPQSAQEPLFFRQYRNIDWSQSSGLLIGRQDCGCAV